LIDIIGFGILFGFPVMSRQRIYWAKKDVLMIRGYAAYFKDLLTITEKY